MFHTSIPKPMSLIQEIINPNTIFFRMKFKVDDL